jgi:hypothetical protein
MIFMRKFFYISCSVCFCLLVLSGCKKKDASGDSPIAEVNGKKGVENVNPLIQEDLSAATKAVQTANYEEAIAKLSVLRNLPKNDAEQAAYRSQSRQVEEMLREKAATDAKAAEAYHLLGRVTMGR